MNKQLIQAVVLSVFTLFSFSSDLFAQIINDGPIELQIRVRDVDITLGTASDLTLNLGNFTPPSIQDDEYTIKVWARDNADLDATGWVGGQCLTDEFNPPAKTIDFNQGIFNHTYTGTPVPQYFDLRVDAWEDDVPDDFNIFGGLSTCTSSNGFSRCDYDNSACCATIPFIGTCLFSEGDDVRCNADPFATQLDYRQGPPCQWYDHGYVTTSNCASNFYRPKIESYWRYTKGTACNNPIPLGVLSTGTTLTHFNSNECYTNSIGQAGNDVYYSFTINAPIGAKISLCGANGAQFNSVLHLADPSCNVSNTNDDFCGNQSQINISLCNPGQYIVIVDATSAAELGTFTLEISEDPTISFTAVASGADITCNGFNDGQAWVNASGGVQPFTYSWSNSGSSDTINNLGPGTYTVTVTDDDGCTTTGSVTINEPAAIQLTMSSVDASCNGIDDGQATASPSGGSSPYTYAWGTAPIQTTQTAILLAPGTYNVTVTDANGCTVTGNATVNPAAQINVTASSLSNVSCFGANDGSINVGVSGGSTPYTFDWSNSATTQNISGLAPGAYTVTVEDNNGCFEVESFVITEPTVLNASTANTYDASCNGGNDGALDITVSGGTFPYNYNWSNSSSNEDLINVAAGSYSITVTDANNCTATASGTIGEPNAISSTITSNDPSCPGVDDGNASVSVSGGTSPYTYLWSDFSTGTSISGLDAGTYIVVITDDNGCVSTDTVTLSTSPAFALTLTAFDEPSCNGATDGGIDITPVGGGSLTYSWTGGASTEDLSNVGAGTYTLIATDATGCADTLTYTLDEPDALTISMSSVDPECIDDSTGVVVATVSGGTNPYDYLWNNNAALTDAVLTGVPEGTYNIDVTDANGCTESATVSIVDPLEDGPNCVPDRFAVQVPTAFTPNGDGQNDYFNVLHLGAFKIEVSVFNRWGEQVYYNNNIVTSLNGWDGTYDGEPAPLGSYAYALTIEYENGRVVERGGSVTLIR